MKTILIVDDHAENRAVLIAMLGHQGHRLLEATGGEEALEMARREKPDLVITDVLMPKMDGFEFVRQLRQEAAIANTPVVFYTASYIEEESRHLANACGVQHVIVKPAEPEEVFKVVDLALGQPPRSASSIVAPEFEREHLHLVTDKLAEKVEELEKLKRKSPNGKPLTNVCMNKPTSSIAPGTRSSCVISPATGSPSGIAVRNIFMDGARRKLSVVPCGS